MRNRSSKFNPACRDTLGKMLNQWEQVVSLIYCYYTLTITNFLGLTTEYKMCNSVVQG